MNVLIGCERSGVIRDTFLRAGHNAWSCDLEPSRKPGLHYQCDVFDAVVKKNWDLFIVHPECRYLCSSGLFRNINNPSRQQLTEQAITFALKCWFVDIEKICLENSIGCLSRPEYLGKATQIIQPHQFGHDASKATCLWLKNLEPLTPTKHVAPRIVDGKKRWANQTDSGQNNLPPSADRSEKRAETYQGVADAMVAVWG